MDIRMTDLNHFNEPESEWKNHSAHSHPGEDEYCNVIRATVLFLFMLIFFILFCLRFFVHGEQIEFRRADSESGHRPPLGGGEKSAGSYDSCKEAPPLNDYFAPPRGRGIERADPAVVVSAVPCIQTGLVPTSTSASWPDARRSGGWWARREAYPGADF